MTEHSLSELRAMVSESPPQHVASVHPAVRTIYPLTPEQRLEQRLIELEKRVEELEARYGG